MEFDTMDEAALDRLAQAMAEDMADRHMRADRIVGQSRSLDSFGLLALSLVIDYASAMLRDDTEALFQLRHQMAVMARHVDQTIKDGDRKMRRDRLSKMN